MRLPIIPTLDGTSILQRIFFPSVALSFAMPPEGGGDGGDGDPEIPDPEVDPPTKSGPRPWPDPDTPGRLNGAQRIFALVVGINEYSDAPLNGCIADVELIESYLHKHYPDGNLQLKTLRDTEATYENIIQAFRTHLCQAGEADTVWFHFSGHGTESLSANEFLAIEPNGKDQSLVCYNPPEGTGQFLLADKEIAVLLHEVATQDAQGRAKKPPHIVVSLDCCHSGSGTRDFEEDPEMKTRNVNLLPTATRAGGIPGISAPRPLESYLYYPEHGTHEIPAAPHVLLSACESIQKAGDMLTGGIFSQGLMNALEGAQGKISYADLFVRARSSVRKIRKKQTPQFSTLSNFDPYTQFLEGNPLGTPDRYEVYFQHGECYIKCGAIQGIPIQSDQPIEVEIQTAAPDNQPVALAELRSIGAQKSTFEVVAGEISDMGGNYQGVIRFLPAPPVWVWIYGDATGVQKLKDHWDTSKNIQWVENEDALEAQLEVEATTHSYCVRDRRNQRQVLELPYEGKSAQQVVDVLGKMVRWERTIALDNEHSQIQQWVEMELEVMDNRMQKTGFHAPEINLYLSPNSHFYDKDNEALGAPFLPKVTVKGATQPLHFYVFHLRSDYSIDSYESEVVFRPDEHPNQTSVTLPLWKKQWGWGLTQGEYEATSYFKVLVTTETLDYQQLLQSGIKAHRDMVFNWAPLAVEDDWCSFTFKAKIVRNDAKISSGLQAEKVSISGDSRFQGRLSLISGRSSMHSQDPASRFSAFDSPEFQLVNLQSEGKPTSLSVIEITDIQAGETRLNLHLEDSLTADETLVPVAFDGNHFIVAGTAREEAGTLVISLDKLPFSAVQSHTSGVLSDNPFEAGDRQDGSLYQALKVAFFKWNTKMGQLPTEILTP